MDAGRQTVTATRAFGSMCAHQCGEEVQVRCTGPDVHQYVPCQDKREGSGSYFYAESGKVFVGEWVNDLPKAARNCCFGICRPPRPTLRGARETGKAATCHHVVVCCRPQCSGLLTHVAV